MYGSYTIVFQSVPQWAQDVRLSQFQRASATHSSTLPAKKLKLGVTNMHLQLFRDQSRCLPGFRTYTTSIEPKYY